VNSLTQYNLKSEKADPKGPAFSFFTILIENHPAQSNKNSPIAPGVGPFKGFPSFKLSGN